MDKHAAAFEKRRLRPDTVPKVARRAAIAIILLGGLPLLGPWLPTAQAGTPGPTLLLGLLALVALIIASGALTAIRWGRPIDHVPHASELFGKPPQTPVRAARWVGYGWIALVAANFVGMQVLRNITDPTAQNLTISVLAMGIPLFLAFLSKHGVPLGINILLWVAGPVAFLTGFGASIVFHLGMVDGATADRFTDLGNAARYVPLIIAGFWWLAKPGVHPASFAQGVLTGKTAKPAPANN